MKKIKWILLAITLALAALFLFATCKKTKAYTYDFSNPFMTESYNINAQGNSGFAFVIYTDTTTFPLCQLRLGNAVLYDISVVNGYFNIFDTDNQNYIASTGVLGNDRVYIYVQLCFDYDLDKLYIYVSPIVPHIQNRQDESPIIDYWQLERPYLIGSTFVYELTNANFITSFVSQQPNTSFRFLDNNNYDNYGLMQFYLFNVQNNFSQDYDEQIEYFFDDVIKNDMPKRFDNYLIDTYYTNGYNAGYQLGYNRGWAEGYSQGQSEGYADGYQDGQEDTQLYQNGYNAGYTAGYSDGEMSTDAYSNGYDMGYSEGEQNGYRNGYQTGYLYGYEQGQAAENAITPAFSVISSVFGVVASVMSIQLFPGITIGLLILVPLFFAVLGLILWIWRRN